MENGDVSKANLQPGGCVAVVNLGIACNSVDILLFKTLSKSTKSLLRSSFGNEINWTDETGICENHLKIFGKKVGESACRNPFNKHLGTVKSRLKYVTGSQFVACIKASESSLCAIGPILPPQTRLCVPCMAHFKQLWGGNSEDNLQVEDNESVEDDLEDIDFVPPSKRSGLDFSSMLEAFNASLGPGVSPLNYEFLAKLNAGKTSALFALKVQEATSAMTAIVRSVIPDFSASEGHSLLEADSADLKEMLHNMKSRVDGGCMSFADQKVLVSFLPKNWGKVRISRSIGVSTRIATEGKYLHLLGPAATPGQKKGNAISEEEVKAIQAFWLREDISRPMPGKNDYVRIRATDEWIKLPKHLLQCTESEAFSLYLGQSTDPSVESLGESLLESDTGCENKKREVSFSTFRKYKPPQVVPMSRRTHMNVCVCKYHQNFVLLCEKIGIKNTNEILDLSVCDRKNKLCMYARCKECSDSFPKVEKFIFDSLKEKGSLDKELIVWQWQVGLDGRVDLEPCHIQGGNYSSKLASECLGIRKHHYVTKTQSAFYQGSKEEISNTSAVVVLDFSENFTGTYQNEIQSMHFGGNRQQTTLHPIVMYIRNETGGLQVVTYAIFSNYMEHSQSAVHCFLNKFLNWCKETHPQITTFKFFSDGCAGQFKGKKAFINLAFFAKDYPGYSMTWSFFASNHGKGPSDRVGGSIKTAAVDEVMRTGHPIRNSVELYEFARKKLKTIQCVHVSIEDVEGHICDFGLENRYRICRTVQGTRDFHHVKPWVNGLGLDFWETSIDEAHCARISYSSLPQLKIDQGFEGKYVACVYKQREWKWYIAVVMGVHMDECEVYVQFCPHPHTSSCKFQKKSTGECYVPFGHILSSVIVEEEIIQGHCRNLKLITPQATLDKMPESFLLEK